jgi:hypothetical protein
MKMPVGKQVLPLKVSKSNSYENVVVDIIVRWVVESLEAHFGSLLDNGGYKASRRGNEGGPCDAISAVLRTNAVIGKPIHSPLRHLTVTGYVISGGVLSATLASIASMEQFRISCSVV